MGVAGPEPAAVDRLHLLQRADHLRGLRGVPAALIGEHRHDLARAAHSGDQVFERRRRMVPQPPTQREHRPDAALLLKQAVLHRQDVPPVHAAKPDPVAMDGVFRLIPAALRPLHAQHIQHFRIGKAADTLERVHHPLLFQLQRQFIAHVPRLTAAALRSVAAIARAPVRAGRDNTV